MFLRPVCLSVLMLAACIAACNAPPREVAVPPKVVEKKIVPAVSKQQALELSEQCSKKSRDEFARGWKDGNAETAEGKATAEFTSHYNAARRTCFYLLSVTRRAAGGAPKTTLQKMLYDANERELYGEYLGPEISAPASGIPEACRVTSFYCASLREWEVLVESYMED